MFRTVALSSLAMAGLLASAAARADIYTWMDASGVVNVSNLAPPAGTRVIQVMVEKPVAPAVAAARDVAREAELQALNDRVRELEAMASQRIPVYAPPPAAPSPVIIPIYVPTTPTPAYAPEPVATGPSCDPTWYGCWSYPYVTGVVVVPSNNRLHNRRGNSNGRPVVDHHQTTAFNWSTPGPTWPAGVTWPTSGVTWPSGRPPGPRPGH